MCLVERLRTTTTTITTKQQNSKKMKIPFQEISSGKWNRFLRHFFLISGNDNLVKYTENSPKILTGNYRSIFLNSSLFSEIQQFPYFWKFFKKFTYKLYSFQNFRNFCLNERYPPRRSKIIFLLTEICSYVLHMCRSSVNIASFGHWF